MTDLAKELTRMLGRKVTSHDVGKWLMQNDLRTEHGKPSPQAFEEGFVRQMPTGRNDGYFYIWHREKTLAVLREAGVIPDNSEESLNDIFEPPFAIVSVGESGFRLIDRNGENYIWARGREVAERLAALLNASS